MQKAPSRQDADNTSTCCISLSQIVHDIDVYLHVHHLGYACSAFDHGGVLV